MVVKMQLWSEIKFHEKPFGRLHELHEYAEAIYKFYASVNVLPLDPELQMHNADQLPSLVLMTQGASSQAESNKQADLSTVDGQISSK